MLRRFGYCGSRWEDNLAFAYADVLPQPCARHVRVPQAPVAEASEE